MNNSVVKEIERLKRMNIASIFGNEPDKCSCCCASHGGGKARYEVSSSKLEQL